MSRRRRRAPIEDLIEVAAMLPWWLAVVLAVASYLVLHPIASAPLVPVTDPKDLSGPIVDAVIRAGAMFGQYLLPAVFFSGGALSAFSRYRNRRLLSCAEQAPGTADLLSMSWQDFEHLVGEAFRARGYSVAETAAGADGGVDLELRKDGELHLVQCKRWRARMVGVEIVRELYGVMAARGAVCGFVVSSGAFTDAAQAFSIGRNIELIDGSSLKALIGAQATRRAANPTPKTPATDSPPPPAPGGWRSAQSIPDCPQCGSKMVLRQARRGQGAGQWFWGCPRFPRCRGTRATA